MHFNMTLRQFLFISYIVKHSYSEKYITAQTIFDLEGTGSPCSTWISLTRINFAPAFEATNYVGIKREELGRKSSYPWVMF